MIPEPGEYLSFLMGADAIPDSALTNLGAKIVKGTGTPFRGLLIPEASLASYKALIRAKLNPGFWNDILGRHEILFIFKLKDTSIRELVLCDANRAEIAQLCSSLNNDPIEKTSDMPRYLAGNPFYRELIAEFHDRSGA
ncbi:MAG TPA: hypothetical protein VKA53_03815 [Thermoanaerobaculia bacterium]|nr:hypothetical protein [Thermoanaerobaculia bacterium]